MEDISLGRIYNLYQQAIQKHDTDCILLYGERYFKMLNHGEMTAEESEQLQNEILDAKSHE